jgi:hypothetical protein
MSRYPGVRRTRESCYLAPKFQQLAMQRIIPLNAQIGEFQQLLAEFVLPP